MPDPTPAPVTCRDCIHARWQLTPTGRIKKNLCGFCSKREELLELFTQTRVPPCLTVDRPIYASIWPDYDASGCPLREVTADR